MNSRKYVVSMILTTAALVPAAGRSAAQPLPGPTGLGPPGGGGAALPPAFSPYLNLTRQGASPAVNYFGIVRPQLQFSASLQSLQTQANQFNPFASPAGLDQPPVTGTAAGFQNYRYYFQNQFTAGGLGSGARGVGFGTAGMGFGTAGAGGAGQPGVPPRRR